MYIYQCVIKNATNFVEEHPIGRDEVKRKGYGEGYGICML